MGGYSQPPLPKSNPWASTFASREGTYQSSVVSRSTITPNTPNFGISTANFVFVSQKT